MSNLTKGLILLAVILGIGAGLVFWKNKVGGHSATGSFNSITKEEIELLLKDIAKTNPMVLKRFEQDPTMKKQQLDNLKQLLAFASQARKDGLHNEPGNRQELENIRAEVIAVNYDKEINQDKGPMPPFGFISEDQVNAFWGLAEQADQGYWAAFKNKIGLGPANRELEFQKFLDSKMAVLKSGNPAMQEREISEEERNQARDFFAKIEIYEDEFNAKARSGELSKEFIDRVNLQVKLQQAQYLARLYSEKLAEKVKVTDEEVDKYIAEHPELNNPEKRTKAQEILNRAKAGEDFAALANEFSEDPGNKGANNEAQGGLYKDVTKGRMVKPFEEAALSLEPGQVYPELVESDFGFHIIKLERKGESKDASGQPTETYDVRHILFSTMYRDPVEPEGREMPVKAYVRNKLETDKEKQALEDVIAQNQVSVPEDFDIPQVSEEQIQEMLKRQQMQNQMPPMNPDGELQTGDSENAPAPKGGPKPAANSANTAANAATKK
ncbi:MAG: peptidylprolyl isomerase [Pyrinomonadaceae bacterium]